MQSTTTLKSVYLKEAHLKAMRANSMSNQVSDVPATEVPEAIPILSKMSNLRSISLRSCPSLTIDMVQKILQNKPQLHSVDFSFCPQLKGLEALVWPAQLESLRLAGTKLSDPAMESIISSSPRLKELDVTLCAALTPKGFSACGHTTLDTMIAANCISMTSEALNALALCGTLQELNVAGCHGVDDVSLVNVLELNNELKALNLTRCHALTDKVLHVLTTRLDLCPNLTMLNLSECSRLSDQNIQLMIKGRPKLQLLGVRSRRLSLPYQTNNVEQMKYTRELNLASSA